MEPETRRRTAPLGVALMLVSPLFFFRHCADHCTGGGVPVGGVDVTGVSLLAITYCDSGSSCPMGIGPFLAILGVLLVAVTLVR